MNKKLTSLKFLSGIPESRRLPLAIFLTAALLTCGALGRFAWRNHQVEKAETYLKKGYPFLAMELLDPYREYLSTQGRGCQLALEVYFESKHYDRTLWMVESCFDHHVETAPVYLAKAATQEMVGDLDQALLTLTRAAPLFPGVGAFYVRTAKIYLRLKRMNDARVAMLKAVDQAPQDKQLALDAMQFFAAADLWEEAGKMAERLKDVQDVTDPEIKLFMAKAFKKVGDHKSSEEMVKQAKILMAAKPETSVRLHNAYPELFE